MDRVTRKELKSDVFAFEVGQGVDYVSDHRREFIRWGAIALAAILLLSAISWYRSYRHNQRAAALAAALDIENASLGPAQNEYMQTFPTQADKDAAATKAFTELSAKYPGSDEGLIGEYYLAVMAADKGDLPQAEKRFKMVVDGAPSAYASLAKLSLAQIYQSQGKLAEGQKLIRSVIDNPTVLVSKEQATIALARLVAQSNSDEARKLLEPLRASTRPAVSRAALTALSEIPKK